MSPDSRHTEELADLLSAYVDLLAQGTAPSVDAFLQGHPALADELRPLLRTCVNMTRTAADVHPLFDADAAFDAVRRKFVADGQRRSARASVESGRGAVEVSQRPDYLLLLLRSAGDVWGITRLVKLLFLLGKETRASTTVPDFFQHVAYAFGPFDDAIYRDLGALCAAGLLEVRRPRGSPSTKKAVDAIYRLTPRGKRFAEALARGVDDSIVEEVDEVAKKYAGLPLRNLLQYVYRTYPEYTTKSKIRDEVLGDDDESDR
jgi:DNA-binding PadR family transcriptional regulator